MNLLDLFIEFLFSQKNRPSKLTVKNYKADVRQFISWFEGKFKKVFEPSSVTPQLIQIYKQESTSLSASSIDRHLSSLRKFFSFLKLEGLVSKSPFDVAPDKSQVPNEDPYKLKGFKNFLYIYNASHLTIKNYIIDIKQFFRWAEEATAVKDAWNLKDKNIFNRLDGALVEEYKNRLAESGISPVSINRKLSSLRRYFSWAASEKLIPSVSYQVSRISDTKKTQECKTEPAQNALRPSLAQASYSRIPPVRLLQKTIKGFGFLFDSLAVTPTAKTIEQGKYILWKIRGRPIFREMSNVKSRTQGKLGIGNYRKAFYAPLTISTKYFPMHKKLWFHLRHTRPNWYRQYHSYPVTHYFHFAILIVFMSAMGFGLYQTFVQEPSSKNPALASGSSPIAPPRILSFQGRLTDASDNPITTSKLVRFQIYSDPTASGAGNLVWQEVDRISPDTDGIFSILLGNTVAICADPVAVATGACIIPQNIFAYNASLYLGVTIGNDPELTPRQQLATVAYATNAEVLQGMAPITDAGVTGNTNAILALNSSGVVSIAGTATTTFQSAGGQITLQGKVLTLTTASGTGTNVQVIPDGLGKIDLQKPILNSTNSNNLATAVGSVEVDDLFSILATSSGQSALTINQDSTGPIISASTSGTAKFTVGNDGSGYFSGNLGVGTLVPLEDFDVTGNATISGTLAVATIKPPTGALSLQYKSGGNAWTTGLTLQDNTGYVGISQTSPAYRLDISTSTANDRGINIAHTATSGTNYGVYSSVTGAATANYGGYFVSTGATTDYGVAIGAMTGATSTGLDIGALSGATNNKAINIGNITGTPTGSNYGLNIGTIATATTNSYGIYIGGPAAAATNYAVYSNAAAKSYFNGNVGIGATSPLAALDVRGSSGTGPVASISANTSFAALVVDNGANMSSTGDLITASSAARPSQSPSGGGNSRTQFRVTNGGSIYARSFYDLDNSTYYLDPAATGTSLSVAGEIIVPGTTTFRGVAYTWPAADGAASGYVLSTDAGGGLSWVPTTGVNSGWWKQTAVPGAITPVNNTMDVLIGGDATTSAKFSFINVSKGTPTASVSAVSAGTGVSIVGDGTIQSLLSGNLTIGGDTTGNIIFTPNNTTTATFKPNILQFTNAATIDSTGTLSLNTLNSQLVTLGGSLQINGGGITSNDAAISIDSGAGNSVTLGSGDVFNLSGNLAQTGVTTFSTGTGLISINGNFNTSLIPNATDYNLGSSTNYWGTVYASNFVSPVGGGTSGYWTLTSNVLAPVSTMFDLVVGGTATSSAKFQAFANSVGDITAGDASTSANLAFSGASTTHNVEILDAGNLNFTTSVGGQGASGANLISRLYIKNTGSIGIGTTTPTTGFVFDTVGRGRFSTGLSVGTTTTTNPVEIVGAVNQATGQVTLGGNLDAAGGADVTGADLTVGGANFSVGQATGNITTIGNFTLPNANSLTGVASYVQFNNGVSIGGGTTYVINATTSNLNSLTLNGTLSTNQGGVDGTKTIIDASGNVVPGAADTANLGAADKEWNNLYVKQIISPATGGIAGYWQLNSSVLSPTNIVNDLAIGGTGTSSAKFQVFGTTIGDVTSGDASAAANLAFFGAGTTHNVELLNAGNLNFATSVGGQGASNANLTSRLYIKNTGNIGISNNNPGYRLDLATSTANDRGINIAHTATTGTNYGVYSSVTGAATANYGGYFVSTGATTDYGVAIAAMTGATSTGLDIGGLSGATNNKAINIANITGTPTGSNYGINIGTIATATTNSYGIYIGGPAAAATNYAIYSNATAKSYLAGNVGIGNLTPLTALDITGSASLSANLSLRGAATAHTFNILDNGSLNFNTSVGGDAALNTTLFIGNGAAAGPGNVGIGTTTPGALLEINNNGANVAFNVYGPNAASETSTINLIDTNNYLQAIYGGDVILRSWNGIQFQTNHDANTGMFIQTDGDVGIGTTSPARKLHISGSDDNEYLRIIASNDVSTPTGSGGLIELGGRRSDGVEGLYGGLLGGRENQAANNKGYLAFFAGDDDGTLSVEAMRISSSGNIGIGTTSPLATIDVRGNSGTGPVASISANTSFAALIIDNGTNPDGTINGDLIAASSAATPITWPTASAPRRTQFRVTNGGSVYARSFYDLDDTNYYLDPAATGNSLIVNGNIGIGNTSPLVKLDVTGSASLSANLSLRGAATAHTFNILDNGSLNFNTSVGGDAALNTTLFIRNGAAAGSGKVGIGTTAPNSLLEISGGSADWNETTPGATTGSIHLNPGSSTNNFGSAITWGASDSGSGTTAQAGIYVRSDSTYGTKMYFGTTDSYAAGSKTRMTILQDGKIGIGTTNPGAVLDTYGGIYANGDISAGISGTTKSGGAVISYSVGAGNRIFKMDAGAPILSLTNDNMTIQTTTAAKYIAFNSGGTSTSMIIGPYSGTTPGGVYLNGGLALGVHHSADGSYTSQYGALSNWLHSHLTGDYGCADADGCIASNADFVGDGTDLAEWYPSDGQVTSGYLVSISSEGGSKVEKSQKSYDKKIMGIISTDPGYQLGASKEDEEYGETHQDDWDPDKNSLVALSGRVPTFVSTINGPIKAGDPITSSDTPGVGMKATKAGPIVGKALEDYENPDPNAVGKIEVFVHIGWYETDAQLASAKDVSIQSVYYDNELKAFKYAIQNAVGEVIDRVGVFAELAVANLRVGLVHAEEIATNSLAVATENVTIGGQNIRDYIVSVVNSAINNGDIVTPIASSDVIHTNLISPLASDNGNIAIRLGANSSTSSSRLEIQNASGSAVATIDSNGNAGLSGNLVVGGSASVSGNLNASEVSIAGTLRADRIIANDIEGLNARIATIAAEQVANNKYYVSSDSGILDTNYLVQNSNGYVDIASLSGQLAYVDNLNATFATFTQGLMSFGPSSLSDVSIAGQLSVGSQLILADNSINVLGSDLQIQPLRQGGISFLSGLVRIDTEGNLSLTGDLTVGGKLSANIISPLPDKDLTIQNASGSSVLAVNQLGDLIASGAGTFSKINLNPVAPALAVSDSEIIATGSAGVATISAQRAQLTIQNSAVTDKSLIYITPIGNTQNQVLYLMRQVPGVSFTVGVGSAPTKEIPFNWMIVN